MKITRRLNRKAFAAAVVKQLKKYEISAVLVGGACVSIYTNERHASHDLDFISPQAHEKIEQALAEIGFKRKNNSYKHIDSDFYVEFPSGPVAIGNEVPVKPDGGFTYRGTQVQMLSPTQSVMDRLSAWYHWNDHGSLINAILICESQPVNLDKIRRWSKLEGEEKKYEQFLIDLKTNKKK